MGEKVKSMFLLIGTHQIRRDRTKILLIFVHFSPTRDFQDTRISRYDFVASFSATKLLEILVTYEMVPESRDMVTWLNTRWKRNTNNIRVQKTGVLLVWCMHVYLMAVFFLNVL